MPELNDAELDDMLDDPKAEARVARSAVKRAMEEDGLSRSDAEALYGLRGNAKDSG